LHFRVHAVVPSQLLPVAPSAYHNMLWSLVGVATKRNSLDDGAIALFAMGRIGVDDRRLQTDNPSAAAAFKRWFPGP
jgi:hypothetical protein